MACLVCGSFVDLLRCFLASCRVLVARALTSGSPARNLAPCLSFLVRGVWMVLPLQNPE